MCLASHTESCIVIVMYHCKCVSVHFDVSFGNINTVYIVLAVIWLYKFVYRRAQAMLPMLVVNKTSHVCTFCLYSLKDCNFNFYLMFFMT